MTKAMTFGEQLTNLRKEKKISLRELAAKMNISAAFLSDVSNGRKPPLTIDRLEKVKEILNLSDEEYASLNDLAGKWNDTRIAPDLPEYLNSKPVARLALRTARDLDASDEEWLRFVKQLQKKRG